MIARSTKRLIPLVMTLWVALVWTADSRAADYSFVTLEYPPLEFRGETGAAEGAAVQLVKRIMDQLGHHVSIDVLPWARALMMVREGKADAIFTIFKNAEREQFLNYSSEILIPQAVAFYAAGDRQVPYRGNFEDLKPFKIGVVSTISYGRRFDDARTMLKVERTASLEQNFSKMLLGRIDLVVSNVYSAGIVVAQMKLGDKIIRLQPDIESVPSYIAFTKVKENAAVRKAFDRKLRELKKSGVYDLVMRQWGLDRP